VTVSAHDKDLRSFFSCHNPKCYDWEGKRTTLVDHGHGFKVTCKLCGTVHPRLGYDNRTEYQVALDRGFDPHEAPF
jgi:hypothetical protein